MQIRRTANAGVLLEMDGVSILLDGVCAEAKPYLVTPDAVRQQLLRQPPDAVAFTHTHADHYDGLFVSDYLQKSAGPVLGPAELPYSLREAVEIGKVTIMPVPSQHLGKTEKIPHYSYVIKGSRCVWFMGDASVQSWPARNDLPHPDVLIAPYSYAVGHGWKVTKELSPSVVVLLHLPLRSADPFGLWEAVEQTVGNDRRPQLLIPGLGEMIILK